MKYLNPVSGITKIKNSSVYVYLLSLTLTLTLTLTLASHVELESEEAIVPELKANDPVTSERQFYKAAVVEYEADKNNYGLTSDQILWQNVENYEEIIGQASKEGTDIIVFPEYGLTTLLAFAESQLQFIPEVGDNPCDQFSSTSSEVIYHLSCAAKKGKIYVVVNLGEIANCDPENLIPSKVGIKDCTTNDNSRKYNTAVAFDRNGQIVAKYRKTHLFAEPGFTAPEIPFLSTFKTDFGIEFGIFICFDILFEFPARELVRNGIQHFIFPTAWIDELPFLTAVQAQMFWASSSNATLLGAGYHLPKFGKLGSGIFLPNGRSINYTADPNSGTKVIYGQVPINGRYKEDEARLKRETTRPNGLKSSQNKNRTSYEEIHNESERFYYREVLKNYTAVTLPLSFDDEQTVSHCDKNFCCQVTYKHRLSTSLSSNSLKTNIRETLAENVNLNSLDLDGCNNKSDRNNCNNIVQQDLDSNSNAMNYKLIVFNQTRKFSSPSVVKTMHLQICGIVRCLNESIQSCAEAESTVESVSAIVPQNKIDAVAVDIDLKPMNSFKNLNEETGFLPNFALFKLHSSTFMDQERKMKQKSSQGPSRNNGNLFPGFNTLDSKFNLIPASEFDFKSESNNQSDRDINKQSVSATLSSNKIHDYNVQTLAIIHRIFESI